jgi:hypothetical protein
VTPHTPDTHPGKREGVPAGFDALEVAGALTVEQRVLQEDLIDLLAGGEARKSSACRPLVDPCRPSETDFAQSEAEKLLQIREADARTRTGGPFITSYGQLSRRAIASHVRSLRSAESTD